MKGEAWAGGGGGGLVATATGCHCCEILNIGLSESFLNTWSCLVCGPGVEKNLLVGGWCSVGVKEERRERKSEKEKRII